MAKRRRRSYIDPEAQDEIETLALEKPTWGPAQIHEYLSHPDRLGGRMPTVRTVQTRVARLRASDTSGTWSLAEATADEARPILETLAVLIGITAGGISTVSKAEAAWIVKLARLAPDMPPMSRWRIGRLYLAAEAHGQPVDDLDGLLVFGPWSGEDGWNRYSRALESRWIKPVPSFIVHALMRDELEKIEDPSPEELESIEWSQKMDELREKTKRMLEKYRPKS